MDGSPGYRRRRWGRRFGQDLKKFKINFPTCLGKLLKQNHHPANLSCSFSSQWRKNSGELKNSPPPMPKIPVSLWWELSTMVCWGALMRAVVMAVTTGRKRGTIPRAPNHYEGAEWLRGAPKSPNNVTSTFFNAVHLLRKDLRFVGPNCPPWIHHW